MPIALRSFCLHLLVLSATSFASVAAASVMPQPNRITVIADRASTPLPESVEGRAKRAVDLGQAPLDHRLEAITLHFSRSAAEQKALDQLAADQQNPSSPRYRRWLTPAQFRAQFGLSDADVAKVTEWLVAQGLTVSSRSATNTFVIASGTVAQAQQAFHVSLHSVRAADGTTHIANLTDPQLPTALGNVVRGITGLSDFAPRPRAVGRTVAKPKFTASDGEHYLAPGDYSTIYDTKPLLTSAINGSGATIAVMGQTSISVADVAAFRSAAGLIANPPELSYNPTSLGVTSADDLTEAMLDVEWAGAIAPNATVAFIATSTTNGNQGAFGSLITAIAGTTTPPPIITISYGLCEPEIDQNSVYVYDSYFQQANVQGQTIVGPGGDAGATDCDDGSTVAADGLAVDFPASSPHVTGVGGLMFNEGGGSYWSSSNGADGSSALSYIPEAVWDESALFGTLAAGGGGRSIFFTKPSWQVGNGVPADGVRDVPDVALSAGAYTDGYLICVSGSCTNGFADASGELYVVGGTSAGTPSFAGMLALLEQRLGQTAGLGNVNPTIYGLGGSSAFHDITTGSNASSCATGAPDCSSSASPIGYAAAAGYDLASGWGSVDANTLVGLWSAATPTGAAVTTGSTPSYTTVALPSGVPSCGIATGAVSFAVSVAAAPLTNSVATTTTVATGTVQLFVDGAASGAAVALSAGSATLTLNTTALSSGAHKIAVAYSGDGTYASSRGSLSPSISPVNNASVYVPVPSSIDVASMTSPDFSFTACQPTLTVASGGSGSVTMTTTSLNGFDGPVTFSASYDGSLEATPSFSVTSATVTSGGTATTVFTLKAAYNTTTASNRGHGSEEPKVAPRMRLSLYERGAGTAALASLLFFLLPRRRRYAGLLALVLSLGAIAAGGCGSGAAPLAASGVPPATTTLQNSTQGYYLINLTASGMSSTGAPLVHTATLTLSIQ